MKTLLTLCLTVAGYAVFVSPSAQAQEETTTTRTTTHTMHHHHHVHHHMHHHMHHVSAKQKPAAERAPGQ